MNKFYSITSLSKDDIIDAFQGYEILKQVTNKVSEMDDSDMEYLARKLADDYCNQLFWDSLRIIFEDRFLSCGG